MNVLIIGNGGREDALAWKIRQSPNLKHVIVAPGSGSSGTIGTGNRSYLLPSLIQFDSSDLNANDVKAIVKLCEKENVHCVVIGPEEPLSKGLADDLKAAIPNLIVFGPSKEGAKLEVW